MDPEIYRIYFWPKFIVLLLPLLFSYHFYIHRQKKWMYAGVGFVINFYAIWSVIFRSEYHASYFQAMMSFAFMTGQFPFLFYINVAVGAIGMMIVYVLSEKITAPTDTDILFELVIYFIISILIFLFLTKTNNSKRSRYNLLSLIGAQSVRHLHDLKGLITVPLLQFEKLKSNPAITSNQTEWVLKIIENLKNIEIHLKDFSDLIKSNSILLIKRTSYLEIDKYSFVIQILTAIIFFSSIFTEISFVHDQYKSLFLGVKIIGTLFCILMAVMHLKKPKNIYLYLFSYLNIFVTIFFSGLFRPGYQHAFFQTAIAACFALWKFPKYYFSLLITFFILFTTSVSFKKFIPQVDNNIILSDRIFEIIIYSVVLVAVYYYFSKEKIQSSKAVSTLNYIGGVAANVSSQIQESVRTTLHLIEIENSNPSWNLFKKDLLQTAEFTSALSSLPCEGMDKTYFIISETVLEIFKIFNTKNNISLTIKIDKENECFYGYKEGFKSIIYNFFINSVEAAQSKNISEFSILIINDQKYFYFEDNAGGISNENLTKLLAGDSFTSKVNGTGLGLQIVQFELNRISKQPQYYNSIIDSKPGFGIKF